MNSEILVIQKCMSMTKVLRRPEVTKTNLILYYPAFFQIFFSLHTYSKPWKTMFQKTQAYKMLIHSMTPFNGPWSTREQE